MSKFLTPRSTTAFPGLFREMDEVQNRLRRFLGEGFSNELLPAEPLGWLPPVEMREDENDVLLTAELPGMAKEDVNVTFDDGILTIRGEKMQEKREDKKEDKFHLVERTYGTFHRAFTIPWTIDPAKIVAEFKDGVLKVRLPKLAKQEPKGRRIEIADAK